MITISDTYTHLDGTPGKGSVSIRPAPVFHDGTRTILGSWQTQPLDPAGTVAFTIDWPAATQPAPVALQVLESVTSCGPSRYWTIGADLLVDGAHLLFGQLRPATDVPPDAPRYVPVPGPAGPAGPLQMDELVHAAVVDFDPGQGLSAGAVVRYQGEYWLLKRDSQAGQSPTTNPGMWQSLSLDDVASKAAHAATQSDLDALAVRVAALEASP